MLPEEDRATATDNKHKKLKYGHAVLELFEWTDRH